MQENNSQNAIKIIDRLKKSLKIKTDIELSEFLNIRPNTISTWKKRDSVDFNSIISICELYELDLNEIFLGKKISSNAAMLTPLISKESQFQYSKDANAEELVEIYPKYNFPFVTPELSRIFQVSSNNMCPTIEENSFVVCERITIDELTEDLHVVLVSKEKGLLINKIAKRNYADDFYLLRSENDFYNDIKVNAAEIREVWKIVGILSYDINNHNKFKFIMDSIKKMNKYLEKQNVK
jgi:hypothetical protein